MIIAIMSDTFARVVDGYEMHSRAIKISLLSDYAPIISKNVSIDDANKEQKDSFLVVVARTDKL